MEKFSLLTLVVCFCLLSRRVSAQENFTEGSVRRVAQQSMIKLGKNTQKAIEFDPKYRIARQAFKDMKSVLQIKGHISQRHGSGRAPSGLFIIKWPVRAAGVER